MQYTSEYIHGEKELRTKYEISYIIKEIGAYLFHGVSQTVRQVHRLNRFMKKKSSRVRAF